MYRMVEVEDRIRVSPETFSLGEKEAIKESVKKKYEGLVEREIGMILAVTEVECTGKGDIIPGDGAVYYPVRFKALCYAPEQNELVKGEVIDITEFGVFVSIGAVDGMVHVSQLMDDFVMYDEKNMMFVGKKTKRKVKKGDVLVARIISVSLIGNEYKIGLTLKQPGLGNVEWFKEKKKEEKNEGKKQGM